MPTTDIEDHNDIQLADGVTAYHGSPHEFEEFDPAFIGTGEGAQAYGHGLYFAENEDVAKGYRDRLADRSASFRVDNIDMPKWILRKIENHPDRQQAIDEVRNDFQKRLSEFEEEAKGSNQPWLASGKISMAKDVLSGLDKIESGSKLPNTRGRMYEVRIDAHPEEHLLDWDKPLNKQHPNIQKAIKNVISSAKEDAFNPNSLSGNFQGSDSTQYGNPEEHDHLTGAALHDMISRVYGHADQSKELSKRGIRGIRYKDAGSRGMDGGSGSHNYVIFDPKHIKTVRRYAEGGGIKAFAIGNSIPHLERASDMIETHDDIQLAPGVEAIDEMPDQAFTSENTSRNQIPALFNSPAFERKRGNRNLDYGGGAFDKGTEYLAKEHGVESHVYDPFNRPKEHNDFVLKGFKKEPADTATVANVLNVIAEPEARLHVIKQVHNHIKPDGKAYFTVYEGDGKDKGSGNSRMTRDGWQEYRPTHSYVEEIKQVFPDVRLSGKTIVASKKPAKAYGGSIIPGPKLTEENADDFARRLIAWTFATAPLFQRAAGGEVTYPVSMPEDIKEDIKAGKAKLKKISPKEFLNEADPLHIGKGDRNIIDSFEHHIEHGRKLGPLKLYEDGHQDGRHRANAAKDLGVKKVPVIDYRKADGGAVDDSNGNWEDAFHATHADVQNFDLSKAGSGTTVGGSKAERAIFLTNDPENAKTYLGGQYVSRSKNPHTEEMPYGVGRHYAEGANIMPLKINTKDFDEWDYGGNLYDANHMKEIIKEAKKSKAPGIKIENIKDQGYMGLGSGKKTTTYVVLDPSRIRSKFAKFDPKKSKKRDLMAAHGGSVIDAAFNVLSKLRR